MTATSTAAPMIDTARRAGLIRMISVDSSKLPGRIEELPLDDHAVILAENGAGKTTLIQLMPIFYGENMSAVVNASKGENFINFYLPRDSSYLAFEYRNQFGEIRSVVLHSNPTKERIQYRFIRGGITASMFHVTNDDGTPAFVPAAGFQSRLRELGVQHADRLVTATKSYRGIIQGRIDDATDSRDRGYHRQLANEYGLSSTKAPLTGIEKLLTQMLRNNVTMKNLLGVVARQASEDGVDTFKMLGDSHRDQISAWPAQFAAYRKVMDMEPVARELAVTKMKLDSYRDEIRDRFAVIAAFEEDFTDDMARFEVEIVRLKDARSESGRAFDARIEAYKQTITDHKVAIDGAGREIERLLAAEAALKARGADRASEKADRIPALREDLEAARLRHAALTSKGEEILFSFEKERRAVVETARSRKDKSRASLDARIAKIEKERDRLAIENAALRDRTDAEGREQVAAIRDRIRVRSEEISSLKERRAAMRPDDGEKERLDTVEKAAAAAMDDFAKKQDAQREASDAFKSAKHAYEIGRRAVADASRKHGAAKDAHEKVRLDIAPKEGSLRAFLRSHHPGWNETIGKVIRPELLQSTGLFPDISTTDGAGIYGLLLDLDKIDIPDAADEARLEEMLEKAQAAVDTADAELKAADSAQEANARSLEEARKALSVADANLNISMSRRDDAVKALDVASDAMKVHIEEKTASLTRDIDLLTEANRAETQRETQAEAALDARRKELRETAEAARRASIDAISEARSASSEELKMLDDDQESELARIAAEEAQALKTEGLDTNKIAEAASVVSRIEAAIADANAAFSLAAEWSRHEEEMKTMPAVTERRKAATYALNEATEALAALQKQAEASRKACDERIEQAEKGKDTARDSLAAVKAQLANRPAGIDVQPERGPRHAEGHEINLAQLGRLVERAGADTTAARNLVKRIAGTFRHCGDEGIAGYLSAEDLGDHSPEWATTILKWYDGDHQDYRDTLMLGISMVAQPIRSAHRSLQDADAGIRRINNRLKKAIRNNEGFPHVRDVDISIHSSITEQPFWADLEAFSNAYTTWKNDQGGHPPEDLIDALKAFLEHWKDGSEPVVRIEDLIYVSGTMTERDNVRKFNKHTDLADLSSNGNIIVLRLILFTALLSVMRRGRDVNLVWAVDEIGALDVENIRSLLTMLAGNGISLLTAAPNLDRRVKHLFTHQMRIKGGSLYRIGAETRSGIREWIADDQLDYPDDEGRDEPQ